MPCHKMPLHKEIAMGIAEKCELPPAPKTPVARSGFSVPAKSSEKK